LREEKRGIFLQSSKGKKKDRFHCRPGGGGGGEGGGGGGRGGGGEKGGRGVGRGRGGEGEGDGWGGGGGEEGEKARYRQKVVLEYFIRTVQRKEKKRKKGGGTLGNPGEGKRKREGFDQDSSPIFRKRREGRISSSTKGEKGRAHYARPMDSISYEERGDGLFFRK